MIIVTGGAGFIGSALVWKLNQRGIDDIVIVDRLGSAEKWRNLVALRYSMFYEKFNVAGWQRITIRQINHHLKGEADGSAQ